MKRTIDKNVLLGTEISPRGKSLVLSGINPKNVDPLDSAKPFPK